MSSFTSLRSQVAGQIFGGPRRESLHHHHGWANYDSGDGLGNGRRRDHRSRAGVLGSAVSAGCHRTPGRAGGDYFRRPRIRHGERHGFADHEHRRHGSHLSGPLFKPRSSRRSAPHLLETSRFRPRAPCKCSQVWLSASRVFPAAKSPQLLVLRPPRRRRFRRRSKKGSLAYDAFSACENSRNSRSVCRSGARDARAGSGKTVA